MPDSVVLASGGLRCSVCPSTGDGAGWVELRGFPLHPFQVQRLCSPGCLAGWAARWAERLGPLALRPAAEVLPPRRGA